MWALAAAAVTLAGVAVGYRLNDRPQEAAPSPPKIAPSTVAGVSPRRQFGLADLATSFSLFTGGAFAFSAIVSAAIFALKWKINYFSVATPTDVVMAAFVPMAVILAVLGAILTVILLIWRIQSSYNGSKSPKIAELGNALRVRERRLADLQRVAEYVLTFALVPYYLLSLMHSLLPGAAHVIDTAIRPFVLDDKAGLYVVSDKIPKSCVNPRLSWAGSNAILATCGGGSIVVIRNPQDLITTSLPPSAGQGAKAK
jgi:hypothetical protein